MGYSYLQQVLLVLYDHSSISLCYLFVCVWSCVCVCMCAYIDALPTVTGLQLFDVTHSTMKARWDNVDGVSGYMLLYTPLSDDGDLDEKEVVND